MAAGLRYWRDRISVPRDMSLHAARLMRAALERTAALAGDEQGPELPRQHRRDQNPQPFVQVA
jgi:glutathione S-transferase